MDNLSTVLDTKTIEDLKPVEAETPLTTTLEPTAEEIELILAAIKEGKDDNEIKKTIRRVVMDKDGKQTSAQGFSYAQIKEIREARAEKIVELETPAVEEPIETPIEG